MLTAFEYIVLVEHFIQTYIFSAEAGHFVILSFGTQPVCTKLRPLCFQVYVIII